MHQYKAEQFLPIKKERAWEFFSSPNNLSIITPPELGFKILSKFNGEDIYEGMKIDYSVKPLFGISMGWQTEICEIQIQKHFIDRQLKGPYKVWEHTHSFIEKKNGVLMTDVINYELPFGIVGKLVEKLLVKRKVKSIFSYRKTILEKIFY